MCGFFFCFSKDNKNITSKSILKIAKNELDRRGPSSNLEIFGDSFYAYHARLSITGALSQPVKINNGIFMYNGEIYNDYENYSKKYGDVDYLKELLELNGSNGLNEIDGEYAFMMFDTKSNKIILQTDTFGTKPLYYAIYNKTIFIASYDSTIKYYGVPTHMIKKVNADTQIKISISNLNIESAIHPLKPFDFSQKNISDLDEFINAFQNSLKKRVAHTNAEVFVPMSSGHDSGLIVAELMNMNKKIFIYSAPHGEDIKILNQRFSLINEKKISLDILSELEVDYNFIKSEIYNNAPDYDFGEEALIHKVKDYRDVRAYIVLAYICNKARLKNQLVQLSGQGVDEIISDYFHPKSNSIRSCMKGDWSKAKKPWKNFYGGSNSNFLGAVERISGGYGIETRYPFLDRQLIQTYLNLPNKLKIKEYKFPLSYRLNQLGFPFNKNKVGFTGFKNAN